MFQLVEKTQIRILLQCILCDFKLFENLIMNFNFSVTKCY